MRTIDANGCVISPKLAQEGLRGIRGLTRIAVSPLQYDSFDRNGASIRQIFRNNGQPDVDLMQVDTSLPDDEARYYVGGDVACLINNLGQTEPKGV